MKRIYAVLLTAAFVFAALSVYTPSAAAATATPAPSASPTEEPATGAGMANPMTAYQSLAEMLAAAPGVNMKDAPEGATGVSYFTITGAAASPIAEIQFIWGGDDYCYRAAVCKYEALVRDIAGVYDAFAQEKDVVIDPNSTFGGSYQLKCNDTGTLGLATWFYAPTGCQYSLFTRTGCGKDQKIEEVVDLLLPILTDVSGEPLPLPQTTLAPDAAKAVGSVDGVVVSLPDNEIVINMDNGNTLTFLLSGIVSVDAAPGDRVSIAYAGDIAYLPEAVTVTVTAKQAAAISGTIVQHDKASFFVKTATGNIYGFQLTDRTAIFGAETALTKDAAVKVTYIGDLTDQPTAAEVEVVTAGKDEPAPENDVPLNKKLDGRVTKLQSKWVYIRTNSGHNYKFKRVDATAYEGRYSLEVGAKIQVTYDGYAGKNPDAKIVKVIAPPDPTPAGPTMHKVSGTIAAKAGNMLEITADDGGDYGFLFGRVEVSGDADCGVGDRATVTFYYEDDGTMHATKVKYKKAAEPDPPVILGPGPVLGMAD